MAKRELTEKERNSIAKNLLEIYSNTGFVPYIDEDDETNEILWATESQIIFDKVDKSNGDSVDVPRVHFWAWIHMLYANFLWVILFIGLIVFTILLMMYDFDISKLYRAIKSIFYDFV